MPDEEMTTAAPRPRQAQPLPQLHGVLVLNKPSGPTSARCLAALKRLGQKKIGHAGTLDPLASGVLLVLLGQATKLSSHLMAGGGKIYSGVLRLGQTTDTWDCQGNILAEAAWEHVSEDDVRREIALWRETREQPVPPYSAAKHEGQPLYRLARKGAAAPAKVKRVEISQADTLDVSLPLVRFRVACSSGTYIRSLAHSLGMRLGCGAVLTELTREYSHPFGLDAARDLRDLTADPALLAASLRPIAEALPHWPRVELTPEQARQVRNGIAVRCASLPSGGGEAALLLDRGEALALARRKAAPGGPCWAVLRGLWN
ncbi:tRNA pseudouridine(55) synthase TruB [Desulfovibrio sp. SGI.169]|uniref:tRNA pseudouridine(55) synthase TruB n=1 Tax=Desulfovibrio sp. SGI.169 TaxID=3420561 RepID=UPI003D002CAC